MPELTKLIQALLDPKAYPDAPSGVTLIQTGISLVFLTGNYVYKVKKPVKTGYLDFTSLEKRQFYCRREVELNRRLCSDAYLGVVSITESNGRIQIAGKGEIIEYAVKMRRLPQEKMLDVLLEGNQVTAEMLTSVAKKVADFHEKAETSPAISSYGSLDMITATIEENLSQSGKYIGTTLSQQSYRKVKTYTARFIEENADLFRQRVAEGKIRDCHGDLHAANICFIPSTLRQDSGQASSFGSAQDKSGQVDDICIYDCIEFNDRFRYCDVASEIAFLAMDLDNHGRADLSKSFVEDYVSFSGDKELLKLLDFYKCYRAIVRGKVNSFNADDPLITADEREKAQNAAKKYFKLAERYVS